MKVLVCACVIDKEQKQAQVEVYESYESCSVLSRVVERNTRDKTVFVLLRYLQKERADLHPRDSTGKT